MGHASPNRQQIFQNLPIANIAHHILSLKFTRCECRLIQQRHQASRIIVMSLNVYIFILLLNVKTNGRIEKKMYRSHTYTPELCGQRFTNTHASQPNYEK